MKHFRVLMALLLIIVASLSIGRPPDKINFEPYALANSPNSTPALAFRVQDQVLPAPPTTYNIEAIYDRDSKSAAVGASAFWKRFTRKDKYVDVHFFGGLDKRQIPVAAILGKFSWSPADQLTFTFGPALEWKQSKTLGLTLFAGVSLK